MKNILDFLKKNQAMNDMADEGTNDENLLLPDSGDYLNLETQYKQIHFFYDCGIRQLRAKLDILNQEFQNCYDRNPIESIQSRIKSPESIMKKMEKRGLPLTVSSMMNHIHDIAGVRVICPFISDVYQVARMLISQTDIELVLIKDYIHEPKPNGYRSLHLLIMADVFFSDKKRKVPVEVQLRTIAMNFWASLEHQLRYKKNRIFTEEMQQELLECAQIIADADGRMQKLAENLQVKGNDYVME